MGKLMLPPAKKSKFLLNNFLKRDILGLEVSFLNNNLFYWFRCCYFSLVFGFLIFGSGYIYLSSLIPATEASKPIKKITAEVAKPQNKALLFLQGEYKVLCNLNFSENTLELDFKPEEDEPYDYSLECNGEILEYLVDSVGGVNVYINGVFHRFIGIQVTEHLAEDGFYKRAVTEIVKGIAVSGLDSEDLLFILNNCQTELLYKDCFNWINYLPELCENYTVL